MRRFVFFAVGLSLVWALAAGPLARGQVSAEERRKRELFLRAREAIEPAPAATPTPAPVKPQPRPRPGSAASKSPASRKESPAESRPKPAATPRATPAPVAKPVEEESEDETPPAEKPGEFKLPPPKEDKPVEIKPTPPRQDKPGAIQSPPPHPQATPTSAKDEPAQEKPDEIKLPPPRVAATPPPFPGVTPPPSPAVIPEPATAAPITVEKSGLQDEEGLAPTPPPASRGFLGFFTAAPSYRYLSRSVRSAIDRAPVKRGRWQYIVVHNSGTRQGNARIFNNYHRNVRKMKNGLAYHFVIGNGTSSGNGEIEIGSRWTAQINGGHVASDYLNNIALGICFVGDFNRDQPTAAQLGALEELIRYLRERTGKSRGRALIVKAHREINPKPTDCPGDRFPYRWLHRRF